MEKLILRPYDKESMRMAMLKHEETFKEQVYELHRLYRIQKTLMKSIEISRSRSSSGQRDDQNSRMRLLDLERPAPDEEYNYYVNNVAEADDDDDEGSRRLDESEIELTLGPTPTATATRKKHGTPLTSDSGPTASCFSSSSTESSHHHHHHMKRTSSISKRHTIGEELNTDGILHLTDMTLGYQRQTATKNNNIDLQQQLKQPAPWLLQVLSMNMT